jgi:hypothetical protein
MNGKEVFESYNIKETQRNKINRSKVCCNKQIDARSFKLEIIFIIYLFIGTFFKYVIEH